MEQLDAPVEVAKLLLDPLNPRLPEGMSKADQPSILAYLYEHDVLDELADSYLANGYFANEQLLVLPPDLDQTRVVVEGNRRLAALKYVLHDADAEAAQLPHHVVDPEPDGKLLESLNFVPAVEVASREELSKYLGFRHINGPKTWSPEAKARYLYGEVEKSVAEGSENPFYDIGRRTGSNSLGVRNAYHAYNTLRTARDDLGLRDLAGYVLTERFGVWTRLLGTANTARYMGISELGRTYQSVAESVTSISKPETEAVLQDLSPRGDRPALLSDSREVTSYSAILGNASALTVLREFGRIDLAAEVANGSDFDNRLSRLLESLKSAAKEVLSGVALTVESPLVARSIVQESRNLSALVEANAVDENLSGSRQ